MAKHWSKEDRHCWQKSEVMQNFEKTLLSNYATLEAHSKIITAQKATIKDIANPAIETQVRKTTEAVAGLNKALSGSADDGEIMDTAEDCAACSGEDAAHDQSCEFRELVDGEEYSDDEVKLAKASVLSELRKMASDAIAIRDMALAYRIERTIQEMLEPEDDQ